MVLSWTKRNVFRRASKGTKEQQLKVPGGDLEMELVIPTHFRCPVSLDLMKDPVTLSTGITYDRESIEKWVESGNNRCPVTNQILTTFDAIPNHAIRRMIQDWCVDNSGYGIQRIPTPRIPLSTQEVTATCSNLVSAASRGDDATCQELVRRIKNWGRESERNKRCVVGNGSGAALARAFNSLAKDSIEGHVAALGEILEVMTWMIPVGGEGKEYLDSTASLDSMVWFLRGNDLGARQSAALMLGEVSVEALEKNEVVIEALVDMVREPIGPIATKSCLVTIFNLVSSGEKREENVQNVVELGLVSLLLEIIVDADRGMCEKALGVLDCVCDFQIGRENVKGNALGVPLVVKKILRVSHLGSGFGVSILWKVFCCDKRGEDEGILVEAIQVGGFQKLLVVLQVGCDESTRVKATELLKLLNGYRSKAVCVVDSSSDFKYLKKSF